MISKARQIKCAAFESNLAPMQRNNGSVGVVIMSQHLRKERKKETVCLPASIHLLLAVTLRKEQMKMH